MRTLFADDYRVENYLQQVDNLNIVYVAMTRPALGMHLIASVPPEKCLSALESGDLTQFSDFSQILYWFASSGSAEGVRRTSDDESVRFDVGDVVDFASFRKSDIAGVEDFPMGEYGEYPSVPLNPSAGDEQVDVRERGRLKYSADSIDFFSEDGDAGIAASNRIKGVVLHDILSRIYVVSDLEGAVGEAVACGDITEGEAAQILELLGERLETARSRGWLPEGEWKVYNETSIIGSDGQIYRPDRVVTDGSDVVIVDYKFGEHHRKYEKQMRIYAGLWRRMGYKNVSTFLWYVHSDDVVEVL
jgi:ATP-dependent exoDNAse (exonuclease V) beta subunit